MVLVAVLVNDNNPVYYIFLVSAKKNFLGVISRHASRK